MLTGYQYFPIGDIITIIICILLSLLMHTSYIKKTELSQFFPYIIGLLTIGASLNLTFSIVSQSVLKGYAIPMFFIYSLKFFSIFCLFCILYYYLSYVMILFHACTKCRKKLKYVIGIFTAIEGILIFSGLQYHIDAEKHMELQKPYHTVFWGIYLIVIINVIRIYLKNKNYFSSKVSFCIISSIGISIAIMFIQIFFRQCSFTYFAFSIPLFTVVILFHYNSFNVLTGALQKESFLTYLDEMIQNKKNFTVISLSLLNPSVEKLFEAILKNHSDIYKKYFEKGFLFQVNENEMCVIYEEKNRAIVKDKKFLTDLHIIYHIFKEKYYMTIIPSSNFLTCSKDYIHLNKFLKEGKKINSITTCDPIDIERFIKRNYIIKELKDIVSKKDLNDDRVELYCQPVLDTDTQTFRTGEILVRLNTAKLGIVPPNDFIPIAENFDYIHDLSLIILNKTCIYVNKLIKERYDFDRLSVNFSAKEFMLDAFCDDIFNIISQNETPFEKIAIEVTETTDILNSTTMITKMNILKRYGILFYLDDFGTGYSNIKRLMELPFDVIKFDTSILKLVNQNQNYNIAIQSFVHTFLELNYEILFEGVETTTDVEYCKKNNVRYLQGYHYSKPIPINNIVQFFANK